MNMPTLPVLMRRLVPTIVMALLGCTQLPEKQTACTPCAIEPVKPAVAPLQPAAWGDLQGWADNDPGPALEPLLASCKSLQRQTTWRATCAAARALDRSDAANLRAWF